MEATKNETEKIILLKEIEQITQEQNTTETKDQEEKKESEKMEGETKEMEKTVKEIEVVSKKAIEEAKKEQETVTKRQNNVIVIRRKALGKKQDKCKEGKVNFEKERDELDQLKKDERKNIEDAQKTMLE